MARLYLFQRPREIAQALADRPEGYPIRSASDLAHWIQATHQKVNDSGSIEATFVIDMEGILCLGDRRSEHVACAGGRPVRSAGEMFFVPTTDGWEVNDVTNQSTGYCPEPASWPEVAVALDQIPLPHPRFFTEAFQFRRCSTCRQLNLVKEEVFECAVCGSMLPREWNLNIEGDASLL